MNQKRIQREVERVASRYRRLWRRTALSATWTAASVSGVAILACEWLWGWHLVWAAPAVAGVAVLAAIVVLALGGRRPGETRPVARQIEARHPELDSRLLVALEQKPDLPDGGFGFLQQAVLSDVLAHARRNRWRQTVPDRRLRRARLANLVSFAALAVVVTGLVVEGGRPADEPGTLRVANVGRDDVGVERLEVQVDPGDTEIERGSSLLVLARFGDPSPTAVSLAVRTDPGDERRLAMAKSLDDPLFGVRVVSVDEDFSYHVEFAGDVSETYRVTVFDYPALTRADARLVYPEYTNLEATTVVDTRHVSAVEGTELTWICHLNKPVARARLLPEEGEPIDLAAGEQENVYLARITLESSSRYRVDLVDQQGRENREPPELVVRVLANRRPDLKFASPTRDVRVSPLEELTVRAKVWDDFGLRQYGLSYTVAGRPPREVVLGESTPAKESREARHLLDFEALEAEPDQLLSYHFWAEDAGPDGQPRRTFSDMYFAEVRHFEEIFREGEQQAGGQSERDRQRQQQGGGQNARQAEQLAELQKQIVNGTWKLIRRAAGEDSPANDAGGDFAGDGELLRDSQKSALEQAGALAERLEDAGSRQHIEVVQRHMSEAVDQLTEAVDGPSPDALRPALAAEQSAYQALLKLRAREHRVARGRNQGQSRGRSRGGQNRSQRQLEQLQLSNSRNRYETQRTSPPRPDETPAQREDRQVANRLRELARRQADLNQRLKELQSALAAARDEEERKEIERQLKRLRDEEEQILRDTDELRGRMDRPENQERMAEAREQLRQTREDVRRASEALREGRVSRAAADGTRAEREFKELRDEFRRRTARQFAEEMEQLRSDAERLDRTEEDLSQRLGQLNDDKGKSLRGASERDEIEQGLEKQKEELGGLLERMRETVKQAEKPEPLLAEKLYDTVRRTQHKRTGEALEVARQLLERGFIDDSSQVERQAREGIRELRQGIDEAARSVLGDGTEALRRARQELERLADELEREVARAESREPGEHDPSRQGEARRGEPRRGEPRQRPGGGRQGTERPGLARGPSGDPSRSAGRQGSRREAAGERRGAPRQLRGGRNTPDGGGGRLEPFLGGGDDGGREFSPIAGEDFLDWSDRLRDVEEMMDDPKLRGDAARIRDRARGIRVEVKRHSKKPNWDLLRSTVLEPLKDLRERVTEELLRRESKGALVPIDGDPVPAEYSERVRRYYRRLGSGE